MVNRCALKGCKNKGKTGNGVKYFCVPKDTNVRKQWQEWINNENNTPSGVCTDNSRLCSDHFEPTCVVNNRLEKGILPTNPVPRIEEIVHKLLPVVNANGSTELKFVEWKIPVFIHDANTSSDVNCATPAEAAQDNATSGGSKETGSLMESEKIHDSSLKVVEFQSTEEGAVYGGEINESLDEDVVLVSSDLTFQEERQLLTNTGGHSTEAKIYSTDNEQDDTYKLTQLSMKNAAVPTVGGNCVTNKNSNLMSKFHDVSTQTTPEHTSDLTKPSHCVSSTASPTQQSALKRTAQSVMAPAAKHFCLDVSYQNSPENISGNNFMMIPPNVSTSDNNSSTGTIVIQDPRGTSTPVAKRSLVTSFYSPETTESLLREKGRKAAMGDFVESDFKSPKSRSRNLGKIRDLYYKTAGDLQKANRTVKALRKRVESLQELLKNLRQEPYISADVQKSV